MQYMMASVYHFVIMKKRIKLLLIFFCVLSIGYSQQGMTLLQTLPTNAFTVTTDQFSNIYLVSNNKIEKYDKNGKFIARYEEFKYGKIGRLDASNAMKLTVYFPDFMKVVYLDKFLSNIKEIDFFMLGYQSITTVCSATDGNIWFYDPGSLCLKKIDENGMVYRTSQPLNIVAEETIFPVFMLEKNGQVFIGDSAKGIFVFDIFATYKKTIPITGIVAFQLFQNYIVFTKENRMESYQLNEFNDSEVSLPAVADIKQAVIEKDRLYLLSEDKLSIYGR